MIEPEQWVRKLHGDLIRRNHYVDEYWRYFDGDHPLGFASKGFRDAFAKLFKAFATNWCPIVVNSKAERLQVDGFRLPTEALTDQAHGIWQANNMDAEAVAAVVESMVAGVGHLLVWPGPDGKPQITVEPSTSCIVASDPRRRSTRQAALRLTLDAAGHYVAELFLPDSLHIFKSSTKVTDQNGLERPEITAATIQWQPVVTDDVDYQPNPTGVVPIVPLFPQLRPRVPAGRQEAVFSALAGVTKLQDAVNKLVCDMMVAAEYAAMPQRWATGFGAEYDAQGQKVSPIEQWGQRLWSTEGGPGEVAFGQFQAADLSNFIKSIEMLVQHIASQSATPPHYFYLRGEFPSGESIRSAEAAQTARVRSHQRPLGEGFEEAMRIAMRIDGANDADLATMETIWKDPEFKVASEVADAAIKRQALGVPNEQLQEDIGYSQEQIKSFKKMQRVDTLLGSLASTPAVAPEIATAASTADASLTP